MSNTDLVLELLYFLLILRVSISIASNFLVSLDIIRLTVQS